ncbi:Uncharacterised protein g8822 [Pycnogonum litorale]
MVIILSFLNRNVNPCALGHETDHESSDKDGHASSDAEEEDLSPEESECFRCLGETVPELAGFVENSDSDQEDINMVKTTFAIN